jgi:hypothetical protein
LEYLDTSNTYTEILTGPFELFLPPASLLEAQKKADELPTSEKTLPQEARDSYQKCARSATLGA